MTRYNKYHPAITFFVINIVSSVQLYSQIYALPKYKHENEIIHIIRQQEINLYGCTNGNLKVYAKGNKYIYCFECLSTLDSNVRETVPPKYGYFSGFSATTTPIPLQKSMVKKVNKTSIIYKGSTYRLVIAYIIGITQ